MGVSHDARASDLFSLCGQSNCPEAKFWYTIFFGFWKTWRQENEKEMYFLHLPKMNPEDHFWYTIFFGRQGGGYANGWFGSLCHHKRHHNVQPNPIPIQPCNHPANPIPSWSLKPETLTLDLKPLIPNPWPWSLNLRRQHTRRLDSRLDESRFFSKSPFLFFPRAPPPFFFWPFCFFGFWRLTKTHKP